MPQVARAKITSVPHLLQQCHRQQQRQLQQHRQKTKQCLCYPAIKKRNICLLILMVIHPTCFFLHHGPQNLCKKKHELLRGKQIFQKKCKKMQKKMQKSRWGVVYFEKIFKEIGPRPVLLMERTLTHTLPVQSNTKANFGFLVELVYMVVVITTR